MTRRTRSRRNVDAVAGGRYYFRAVQNQRYRAELCAYVPRDVWRQTVRLLRGRWTFRYPGGK